MSVLVYTENWEGKFKKLSYELVSYAAAMAEMLNTSLTALSIGEVDSAELESLGRFGASKIVSIENEKLKNLDNQAYTAVIADMAKKLGARVIILANNNTGKAVAPRLSVKLKAGVGAGVSRLPSSLEPFTVYKRVYSGNAYAHIVIKTEVRILTLAQNSFDIAEGDNKPEIEKLSYDLDPALVKTEVRDVNKQSGKLLLTDAEIVVSGGRGMRSPDNWAPIVELADLLGGATACSRPVSDEGWRPHEEHTGQTGKIIAPDLYIAVGISGATQHIAGVSASKCIVAINTDKDAPVFDVAKYGMVGDAMKVLPGLIEAVKNVKSA
ncbi:MAG TPA: electron transfer flavoprotein subunit alpha/FixB family protein [Bacteroidetes bacterium]|nr:electron transfer flavoprotein subunit alpha/FixB family protein [Bacteroidota bacterium]